MLFFFFFQAEDGIRDGTVTGVQTCALPIFDDLIADHALDAWCSAWSMSQRMSSSVSMPTEMRIMSGVTPAFSWSASLICRCVVEAGWMISVFASPMLAR